MFARPLARFALLLTLAAALGACDDDGLRIEPIEPQIGYVGEFLDVPFELRNPGGEPITLSFDGPSLPFLDRWVSVVPAGTGGRFQWDPQDDHVGRHRFTILARAGEERAARGFDVEIVTAREATPVFLEPTFARAFDLRTDPCIAVPISVRDNDSDTIELTAPEGMPTGATLDAISDRAATLRWCPTPDQIAAREIWRITLAADDGEHDPTLHDLRVILLAPKKSGCPGGEPRIDWLSPEDGVHVVSEVGYDVRIRVEDDAPLREAPVLFYTDGRLDQRDRIDIATLRAVPFVDDGDAWRARIPTFRLAEDEVRTITMIPWVTDDDDPTGTRCDHRAAFRARAFVAVGAVEAGILPLCAPCTQSGDCASNVCLASPTGGRCAPACDEETACGVGTCAFASSPEGVVRQGCGPVAFTCDGRPACVDDELDEDVRDGDAVRALETEATGTLCGRTDDRLRWTAPGEGTVTFRLESRSLFRADAPDTVEMLVLDGEGVVRATDSGDSEGRTTSLCVAAGQVLDVQLTSPVVDDATWTLRATFAPGPCACLPTRTVAPPIDAGDTVSGDACGIGYTEVAVRAPAGRRTTLTLDFDAETADLDLDVFDEAGDWVGRSSRRDAPETVRFDLADAATLTARVYAWDGGGAPWTLTTETAPLSTCDADDQCDADELCDDGTCRQLRCVRNADCPERAICPRVDNDTDGRSCALRCESDDACDDGARCKAFPEGRTCRPEGEARTGEPCSRADDCAGLDVCVDWPGGYCAAAGCDVADVCAAGEVCGVVDNRAVCLAGCWVADDQCTRDAPYVCDEVFGPDSEVGYACVPTVR